jgi:hypothetical protein
MVLWAKETQNCGLEKKVMGEVSETPKNYSFDKTMVSKKDYKICCI